MPLAREPLLLNSPVAMQFWTKPGRPFGVTGWERPREVSSLSGFGVSAKPFCSTKFRLSLRRMAL